MSRGALLVIGVTMLGGRAGADGFDVPGPGARAIARAGAGLVRDDAGAVLVNPAGLARRTARRAQLGVALAGDTLTYTPAGPLAQAGAPVVQSRAGVGLLSWGGVVAGVGDDVVVAAYLGETARAALAFPRPGSLMADDRAFYPQRYGGERLSLGRTTCGVGAAARALPWLAIGASALVTRVALAHAVTVWGGADAADDVGALDPRYDMSFTVSGAALAPGAAVTAIIAPLDVPLELAAGVSFRAPARVQGVPALTDSRGNTGGTPLIRADITAPATARLELPGEIILRGGARLVVAPAAFEADVEVRLASGDAAWELAGMAMTPQAGEPVSLARVPLGGPFAGGVTVRAAVDVDVVPGFLTLTTGYAFSAGTVDVATPVLPAVSTHTVALGLEARLAPVTVVVGVARSLRPGASAVGGTVVAPRSTANGIAAAPGDYASGATFVALDMDVEF